MLLLAATPASGNDSSATLGAGGIVLTTNEDIALEREDLYISTREIRVRYEFRNATDRDVETIVAFPLPLINQDELAETDIGLQSSDPVNFVDFIVVSDGQRIEPAVQTRAKYEGEDITDYLLAKGVKLSFFEEGFYEALLALGPADRDELSKRGYAFYEDYGPVRAGWQVETTLHWPQRFPAGKLVVIEHSYKPVVGGFFVSKYVVQGGYLDSFCVDEATRRAISKRIKERSTTADEEGMLTARNVDYILTTANNWRGPIGTFHLTLDKESPDNLVSLCIEGLDKTGPHTFEALHTNFVPTADLSVLVLE